MTTEASGPDADDPTRPIPAREADLTEADLTDADRIRIAVLGCPGVVDLSAGSLGEVRSYLPGRSVAGVRVDADQVEVHIVAAYGQPLRSVADQIAEALKGLLYGRSLKVSVDDIVLPGEDSDASEDSSGASVAQ